MIYRNLMKKVLTGFSTIAVALVLVGGNCVVAYASEEVVIDDGMSDEGIVPHSDIIEYRYKVEGTKVYRRLYNYSKECWVGEWEFVTEGYIKPGM